MGDNGAVLIGYTVEVTATNSSHDLALMVKPGTDYDDKFKAWCMDEQEFIWVSGWLFNIEEVA